MTIKKQQNKWPRYSQWSAPSIHFCLSFMSSITVECSLSVPGLLSGRAELKCSKAATLTLMCSCSWISCWRDSCSCCLWNSAISSCLCSCCLCLRATSSCCSCCSWWSASILERHLSPECLRWQVCLYERRSLRNLLMTEHLPGSDDVGQAVEDGGVGWGWETRPKVGCCWWLWWWSTRRSMGRMAVAAGGTCMGSAAALTSTGTWDKPAKQRIII